MWTRRQCLALVLPSPPARTATPLSWADLRPAAQQFARQLDLTPANWTSWQDARKAQLAERILAGTAEHVTYFYLQSRAFTTLEPLAPIAVAHARTKPVLAQQRSAAFEAAEPRDHRHRLIAQLERWPLERCHQHTMAFLRAKEIEGQPLDRLYFDRGLSSDTQPSATQVLGDIPEAPKRILLAGPGLDFTRREKFTDDLPLRSHQFDWLREKYPQAVIDLVDVRPEVISVLNAHKADITNHVLPGPYDLIIATNLLLYIEDRELLTALAGLALALKPGGRLLHNDQRFAAKVFGEACGLPVERFAAQETSARRWDRAVIHRKESA